MNIVVIKHDTYITLTPASVHILTASLTPGRQGSWRHGL